MKSLLIKNGYLITMDAAKSQFYGDLFIKNDRVVDIGPAIDQEADKTIDASGMLVLPGFIQTHIHLCQSLFRGQADDQHLLDWLVTITTLESKHTPETLYASARLGLAELIKSGTTAIIDMGTPASPGQCV